MARLTLQQRAFLLGLRRGRAQAHAERERLTERLENALEEVHAQCAAVRAELVRRHTTFDDALKDIDRDPNKWLH